MARKALNDNAALFRDWLVDSGIYSISTSRQYSTASRTIYKKLGESRHSQKAVDDLFGFFYDHRRSTYNALKRAWVLYSRWSEEVLGEPLPLPAEIQKVDGEARSLVPLASVIRDALRALKKEGAISFRMMTQLCWSQVELGSMMRSNVVHVRHPSRAGEVWVVPSAPLRALFEYAHPGGNLSVPLVPLRPGSVHPYPYRGLVNESQQFTEDQVQAMLEGRESSPFDGTDIREVRQRERTERVKARAESRARVAEATGETPSPVDNIADAIGKVVPAMVGAFDVASYQTYTLPSREQLVALDTLGKDDDER